MTFEEWYKDNLQAITMGTLAVLDVRDDDALVALRVRNMLLHAYDAGHRAGTERARIVSSN